ncbi:MAG: 1-acyl-sn-glycerol-3-phosphate acyltransferase [Legionellaceae bacterium]|nr:1-acyl-sn-glycerol-3-phosphate acyltransferase [Legionellaceae bacterium]
MSYPTCERDTSYDALLALAGVALATYAMARFFESQDKLGYETRSARMISGFLQLTMHLWHTTGPEVEITSESGCLIALGPHRASLDAFGFASKIKLHGTTPPQFFATDVFNVIPGVTSLFDMFKVITIKAKAPKDEQGRSGNAAALDEASRILQNHGCVAVFPQGNFARIGQKPPRIYNGTANLAITNKLPIHVIRLDGFWSLKNPVIPLFIRNNTFYRAFFALFHMNRVRVNLCDVIDVHLQAEHENSSHEEKIEAINARLYACYRQTEELTPEKIDKLKPTLSDTIHLSIWRNKLEHHELTKKLTKVEAEASALEERVESMMAI